MDEELGLLGGLLLEADDVQVELLQYLLGVHTRPHMLRNLEHPANHLLRNPRGQRTHHPKKPPHQPTQLPTLRLELSSRVLRHSLRVPIHPRHPNLIPDVGVVFYRVTMNKLLFVVDGYALLGGDGRLAREIGQAEEPHGFADVPVLPD